MLGLDTMTVCELGIACPPAWVCVLAIVIATQLVVFAHQLVRFHYTHRSPGDGKIPPKYPFLVPYLGAILPLLRDTRDTLTRLTCYNGKPTVSRVPMLPGIDVYLYQDPDIIERIWKVSSSLDFRPMAVHFLRNACGLSRESANLYLLDKTGMNAKPLPGTSCPEHLRVYRKIYESDRQALIGPGLDPTLQRFIDAFSRRMAVFTATEWIEMEDFWTCIQHTVAAAEIEAIFGPKFLEMHPDFISLFFEYDRLIPSLLKMLPFSRVERLRSTLHAKFRSWVRRTRKNHAAAPNDNEGDHDPHWGCRWTRYRHEAFQPFFDDDAIASINVGVAWGALANTTPCAMMAIIHALQDASLHQRLRRDLDELCNGKSLKDVHHKELTGHVLLSAIFAETLRLHMTVLMPVIPLDSELDLGRWRIPRASWGFINAGVAHHNEHVWNTKGGLHRVESFWADRFIVDPADPSSGPSRHQSRHQYAQSRHDDGHNSKPYFSLEGLEGSWVPFGGRFLAKGVITFALAMMVSQYDIELLTDTIPTGNDRFGIGVELPTRKIPFRIRKRRTPNGTH
ncbi:hypothetical protein MHUMG1_10021 [Metarhizium humberi]|uniref:Cytochrome P450 n=1 Tax=Metarhizium humberi TaxID=2596975 RepID=A0A9P8M1K7_9HYPO|nr:hypothetical protein MHUMG1_10021 [Metarhizium humberi]